MAYTRAWTTTTPADVDQASTLGAAVRNLRTDVQERMNTLLNNGWASDPVAGFPITKVVYIHPTAGTDADSSTSHSWYYLGAALTAGFENSMSVLTTGLSLKTFMVPVKLPVGATLKKIRAAVFRTTGATTATLSCVAKVATVVSAPADLVLGTPTSTPTANSTWAWADLGLTDHVVAANEIFSVVVQGKLVTTGDVRFGGLEVTYTVPDLLTSL